jgi:glycosyltransferase involved in cell wall biosynthesis
MSYFSLFTCRAVCTLRRKKLIVTWHEVWGRKYWVKYLSFLGNIAWLVERMTAWTPDEIISISPLTTRKLCTILKTKKKITEIPNGINLEAIQRVKPTKKKYDVIYAGRFLEHKHIDALVRALALTNKKQRVTAVLIGDGPEKEKCIKLASELGVAKKITFKPFLKSQNDVYAYMKSSKVFVLPSTREGFGIVVLEANACGIPVITTNAKENGARELVRDSNGLLADTDAAMARSILLRIDQSELNNKFIIDYDWTTIAKNEERRISI